MCSTYGMGCLKSIETNDYLVGWPEVQLMDVDQALYCNEFLSPHSIQFAKLTLARGSKSKTDQLAELEGWNSFTLKGFLKRFDPDQEYYSFRSCEVLNNEAVKLARFLRSAGWRVDKFPEDFD